jgi:hypothetical protein
MPSEIDEQLLTDYALGEADESLRRQIEARLASSEEDRQHVQQVQSAARLLSDELCDEESPELGEIHRAAIELRLRSQGHFWQGGRRSAFRSNWGVAIALAASIVIVCALLAVVLMSYSANRPVAGGNSTTQPKQSVVILPLPRIESEVTLPGANAGGGAFVNVAEHPISSFPINTDTASYEELRDALLAGRLPDRKSVRIEGLINAFSYGGPEPKDNEILAGTIEVGPCPWETTHRLARIELKSKAGTGIVADNVRAEVAFNPASAKSERIIGYDDATATNDPGTGEVVQAGHTVTVLYEVIPSATPSPNADLLTLRVRYRPRGTENQQVFQILGQDQHPKSAESADQHFSAAVAQFGMLLKGSPRPTGTEMDQIIGLAESGVGSDPSNQRRQFIALLHQARTLVG